MTKILKNNSFLIKAMISAALVLLISYHMDVNKLMLLVGQVHIDAWFAALLCIFLQILVLSYRWNLFINVNQKQMTYMVSLRITLVSFLANYLFITSVGGIIVRIFLSVQHGVSLIKSIAATALDRAMTFVALIIIAALFLPILHTIVPKELYNSFLLVVGVSVVCCGALFLMIAQRFHGGFLFTHRKLAVCYKYVREIMTDKNLLAKIIASSLIGQVMYFAAVYVIITSLGAEMQLWQFMAILPIITIVASLPVGYGGWGIREGAFIYGLGLIQLPIETAFIASIQIGLISLMAALIAGIPAFFSSDTQFALKNWRLQKMRAKYAKQS